MTAPPPASPAVTRLYSIAPGLPALDALAAGCLARAGDDPLALAGMTVLLPTRRACRALREAFLRQTDGRPLLLPRLTPLGDLDSAELELLGAEGGADALSLPPPIPGLRRRLLLARLILGRQSTSPEQAVALAESLARLLDQVQAHGLELAGLAQLVPEDYARHWQKTLDFLTVLGDGWPAVLQSLDAVDPAAHRNAALDAQTARWQASPPAGAVIVAGTAGGLPALDRLIACVAALPDGAVVLDGLDRDLDEAAWAAVDQDPSHPQAAFARLLKQLAVPPAAVADWAASAPASAPASIGRLRARCLSVAMLPASQTHRWRSAAPLPAAGLDGVGRIDCAHEAEEAAVIALLLREVLERPTATGALITPDRNLARRVAAELRRYDIEIDDSAGRPLSVTPVGAFLRLVAGQMTEPVAPVALLALLQHPLAAGGRERTAFRRAVRALDRGLRGPRPMLPLAALGAALRAEPETPAPGRADAATRGRAADLLDELARHLAPLLALRGRSLPLGEAIAGHIRAAEALAATDLASGADRLWAGEEGEAAAGFLAELIEGAGDLPPLPADHYPALFDQLLTGLVVRPVYGRHPRLHIWGLMEARLQQVDRVVLGGLNDGVWPAEAEADPWLSRPMRRQFGLPSPELRIGEAAHDFARAFGAPEVFLTRAERVGGAPAVPSRWLLRLDSVLRAAGRAEALAPRRPWLAWVRALDRPGRYAPCAPPAPRPPVIARPRGMSVTSVETWMRDPYAIYARRILKLNRLEALDADPGAADRGRLIHQALDEFLRRTPGDLPPDARARLIACGEAAFAPWFDRPGIRSFWWPRFLAIADWFLAQEADRRPDIRASLTEIEGRLVLDGPAGPWTLTARADRIDQLVGGGLRLIDYKTGAPPSQPDIIQGLSPQLPLEAAIARAGGFGRLPAELVAALEHWHLSGGRTAGAIKPVNTALDILADDALAGLTRLIALFDDPATPYAPIPRADKAPRYNDYAQLARLREWGGTGDGGDEGE